MMPFWGPPMEKGTRGRPVTDLSGIPILDPLPGKITPALPYQLLP